MGCHNSTAAHGRNDAPDNVDGQLQCQRSKNDDGSQPRLLPIKKHTTPASDSPKQSGSKKKHCFRSIKLDPAEVEDRNNSANHRTNHLRCRIRIHESPDSAATWQTGDDPHVPQPVEPFEPPSLDGYQRSSSPLGRTTSESRRSFSAPPDGDLPLKRSGFWSDIEQPFQQLPNTAKPNLSMLSMLSTLPASPSAQCPPGMQSDWGTAVFSTSFASSSTAITAMGSDDDDTVNGRDDTPQHYPNSSALVHIVNSPQRCGSWPYPQSISTLSSSTRRQRRPSAVEIVVPRGIEDQQVHGRSHSESLAIPKRFECGCEKHPAYIGGC